MILYTVLYLTTLIYILLYNSGIERNKSKAFEIAFIASIIII